MRLLALAAALHLAQSAAPDRPRPDTATWYVFMAERFSRSDGANALYESTRRGARKAAYQTGGS